MKPHDCTNSDFAQQFLKIQSAFVGGLPQRLLDIQQSSDKRARYSALHQLTGAAGSYGFSVLSARARDAMDAVRIDINVGGALASLENEIVRIYALPFDNGAIL